MFAVDFGAYARALACAVLTFSVRCYQNTSNNPMHNIQVPSPSPSPRPCAAIQIRALCTVLARTSLVMLVGNTRLEPGMELQPFTEVTMLSAGASTKVNLYIDFGGKTK
eukprot:1317993-Rhodomonas_salina.2